MDARLLRVSGFVMFCLRNSEAIMGLRCLIIYTVPFSFTFLDKGTGPSLKYCLLVRFFKVSFFSSLAW